MNRDYPFVATSFLDTVQIFKKEHSVRQALELERYRLENCLGAPPGQHRGRLVVLNGANMADYASNWHLRRPTQMLRFRMCFL